MQIRHCVEEANVDKEDMKVIDPTQVRHVTVLAGKIDSMSGLVDPASHLNLDFPDHRVTTCIIAEKFEKGAPVQMDDNGMIFATVDRSAYKHYGTVDYTQRLTDMIKAVQKKGMMMAETKSSSASDKKKKGLSE
ncbi:hypothetical protein NTE_02888 [Candidatus Nitrososphaera evergladensis SR1]|uniref:Uncharacterized protein n=1 Tax=Candidatus Nitrososphaera evergladensis SR1 TaxID=1459636 RepID=A0A075MTI3_9ARCH|nr:hypothetical protein [Candidatus Nitrososphaera evergladensis]AIF84926.1 hypothetical protein NTE_02888 [Candidatus Nitrososphaera evergladensis SR1]